MEVYCERIIERITLNTIPNQTTQCPGYYKNTLSNMWITFVKETANVVIQV